MNMLLKSAVAGALVLGASSAFAVGTPISNNSDLLLVVDNVAAGAYYVLDTGISLNSLMPSSSLSAGQVLNTSLAGLNTTIAASATLQAFMAANPAAGDSWTLLGGQAKGGFTNANKTVGNAVEIMTSNFGTINNANVSGKNLGVMNGSLGGLNTDLTSGNYSGLTAPGVTEITGSGWTQDVEGGKYGFFGLNSDSGVVGTSSPLQLFGFTGGGTTGLMSSYILGSATLAADGTLAITGNGTVAPVPLPAAVWLFGSGLMGLVGVSRRRKAAAVTAAV